MNLKSSAKYKAVFTVITGALFALPTLALALTIDTSGGDCASIGTWNDATKTCTLIKNIKEPITLASDNITLDGARHTLTGSTTTADYVAVQTGYSNITIKSLTIKGFSTSLGLGGSNSVIEGNTIITAGGVNDVAIAIGGGYNTFRFNTITGGGSTGVSNDTFGSGSGNNTFLSNTVSGFTYGFSTGPCSMGHIWNGNTIKGNFVGLYLTGSDSNMVVHNNFITNSNDIQNVNGICGRGYEDVYQPMPIGGNYYSKNTSCIDTNSDGICDRPYKVTTSTTQAGQPIDVMDSFPWIKANGWNAPHLGTVAESEDDGKQDTKGIANTTKFTFSVPYTGAKPTYMRLVAVSETGTSTKNLSSSDGFNYSVTSVFPKGHYVYHIETKTGTTTVSTTNAKFTAGYSNVVFLPGLEASRLYRNLPVFGEVRIWEPPMPSQNGFLYLNASGTPLYSDIYTRDIIDNAYLIDKGNVYYSFIAQMNSLKGNKTIVDWSPFPYDWRYSVTDIVGKPIALPNGATYSMVTKLKSLAASSDTGKVTIIAHSNGGLVTKALSNKLATDAPKLIDQMIFVAVPEAGTPQAVGAILHGFEQGLPTPRMPITITATESRTLAKNMPSAYGLLPSASYFTSVTDPVITISTTSPLLAPWRTKYGSSIQTEAGLRKFLTDTTRKALPVTDPLIQPVIGNATLLTKAETLHTTLDTWVPPAGVPLTEVAGWGIETLRTIDYSEGLGVGNCGLTQCPVLLYTPKKVLDGDGTVVVPSALWMPAATGVKRWWLNLGSYNKGSIIGRSHADILEVPQLRTLISNILTRSSAKPPQYISATSPVNPDPQTRLHFILHSPLTLSLTDDQGNHTGIAKNGTIEQNIPGSTYETFGEVQYISVLADSNVHLQMNGYETGTFTLDVEEVQGDETISSTRFTGIPSSARTIVKMDIQKGKGIPSLSVDMDGNGKRTVNVKARRNGVSTVDTATFRSLSGGLNLKSASEEAVF